MPGAAGARYGADKARAKKQAEKARKREEHRKKLKLLIRSFGEGEDALTKDGVKALLEKVSANQKATPPTEAEAECLLQLADRDGSGAIEIDEVATCISAWEDYLVMKANPFCLETMTFDEVAGVKVGNDGSAPSLDKVQYQQYLAKIQPDDDEVTADDVEWLFGKADVCGTGKLEKLMACASVSWLTDRIVQRRVENAKAAKSQACAVL